MEAKTYKNVIELYNESGEFRRAFKAAQARVGLDEMTNYFDDYSDRPQIVDCVLSDIIDRGRWKFECSNHKDWRSVKITITMVPSYWTSPVGEFDDFGSPINHATGGFIVDAKTNQGPWAIMTPETYAKEGNRPNVFGLGIGQKYQKQADGKWLKIEG